VPGGECLAGCLMLASWVCCFAAMCCWASRCGTARVACRACTCRLPVLQALQPRVLLCSFMHGYHGMPIAARMDPTISAFSLLNGSTVAPPSAAGVCRGPEARGGGAAQGAGGQPAVRA